MKLLKSTVSSAPKNEDEGVLFDLAASKIEDGGGVLRSSGSKNEDGGGSSIFGVEDRRLKMGGLRSSTSEPKGGRPSFFE